MAADEPPYLTVGTDVSAKYKGAFCEAKIKKVNRVVKCKVTFKNNLGAYMITDDQIKGPLRIGADIEAKHPEKNQFFEAVINKLQDYSQYTVVFDDGDETTLRRTSLCLKSGRHFAESPTLDQFPLTNPEHFGTPVIGAGKYKRKRRSTMNSSLDYGSSDEDSLPRKLKAIRGKERDPDLGKVVCVDYGDRRKKDSWYPGLIVPHPAQSNIKISKEEHLIRSFKDGKYYQVPKKDTREFNREIAMKVDNNTLRTAVEKAVLYLEKEELPPHWDKALFQGLDFPSADEDSHDSDSDSSDDEPSEEKDRFVAQLYKFMDERGTPINKAPTVSNRDLNLYKLFKIMHKLGGYNKVTNKNKWKAVYSKMNLPQSNLNGPNQIKFAYKRRKHRKDKRENPVREKREDRSVKDKRDSSKEPKEEKTPKGKKEDIKSPEEKSPLKKKLERLAKEKKEEKVVRPRREDKSPSVDVSKKPVEDIEAKIMKEEKVLRVEIEIKKEDAVVKDKLKPKLREKREDTPLSEDGHEIVDLDVCEDKESMSLDGFEKRGPGPRLRGDDTDESLNKGKRRSLKDDRDEKDSIIGLSDSDDESFTNDSEKAYNKDVKHNEIEVGDRVKVKYGRGRMQKVYEAKVLKVEMDGPDKRFYVHYAGWNMRCLYILN
ncbi:AT-rich interactive domain-containing protein 4B-like [Stegodyphus dumicola]|uniref:AT-rich interactive domain-containing protein 4B-like n=1 Tax=Stegodyphus dumicola TaxID=202533 RepID=UPI0015A832D4|nr:AT-rich interactive domain-containing protein 4B-like [Stegodyphus dumicola]